MWKCRLVKSCLVFASILVIAACSSSEKKLVDKKCGSCHSVSVVYNVTKSQGQWQNTINAMVVRGMKSTPEENARILAYLMQHNGIK